MQYLTYEQPQRFMIMHHYALNYLSNPVSLLHKLTDAVDLLCLPSFRYVSFTKIPTRFTVDTLTPYLSYKRILSESIDELR